MSVLVHVYMIGIQHRATSFVNIYLKVSHWPWDSPIARLASTPSFSMSGASALAIEPSSEIPLKYFWLLYMCTCIHIRVMFVKECWCVCTAHAWRSEDDFREWVLSSHCEFQGLNSSLHACESKASCSLGLPMYPTPGSSSFCSPGWLWTHDLQPQSPMCYDYRQVPPCLVHLTLRQYYNTSFNFLTAHWLI